MKASQRDFANAQDLDVVDEVPDDALTSISSGSFSADLVVPKTPCRVGTMLPEHLLCNVGAVQRGLYRGVNVSYSLLSADLAVQRAEIGDVLLGLS
jgi:hypothetical protein